MFVGGLVAAIFIVTALTGLMAVLVMYVVSLGMLRIAAVIVVAAVNLIAGAGTLYWCINLSRHLLFAATRRQCASRFHCQVTRAMMRAPTLAEIDVWNCAWCSPNATSGRASIELDQFFVQP
jgi:hypothetical protein